MGGESHRTCPTQLAPQMFTLAQTRLTNKLHSPYMSQQGNICEAERVIYLIQ